MYKLLSNRQIIKESINLEGSKSISNRVLIIRALCDKNFEIQRLAKAQDTSTLERLLMEKEEVYDVGPAGTTFRFLTAYLALQDDTQILTGSERMKQRPIGILVKALNDLGADIEYLEEEGYPPLKINSPKSIGRTNELFISAGVSSQFISALLLIAPVLPEGLTLELVGKIVSRPYIQMTLNLMQHFGIDYTWEGNRIAIKSQAYEAKDFVVEGDWSAASYHYAIAAFSQEVDLQLNGLFPNSVQGDAVLSEMMTAFGIESSFNETGVRLTKQGHIPTTFGYDFLTCPDIAQTLAVICGGLGVEAHFTGLETLKIKETDRVEALKQELRKVNVELIDKGDSCTISGRARTEGDIPRFATYHDHRMAMAFAPLALLFPIEIEDPMVVGKSYPSFWEHLSLLGMKIK